MVVVMKPGTQQREIDKLVAQLQLQGLTVGITNGVGCTILGLVGDTTAVDMDKLSVFRNLTRRPTASSTLRIPSLPSGAPKLATATSLSSPVPAP